jgi:hypothetical protein
LENPKEKYLTQKQVFMANRALVNANLTNLNEILPENKQLVFGQIFVQNNLTLANPRKLQIAIYSKNFVRFFYE